MNHPEESSETQEALGGAAREVASAVDRAGPSLPRETLVGVQKRDPRALSDFFEFSFDRVYSLAARLLGDRGAAEDVAQEVFLKVHHAADRLDPDRDPLPWLTTITYNVCRDLWRSREHKVAARATSINGEPGAAERLAADGADPEAQAMGRERDRVVQEALMQLPEELRDVVILRDYHGMRHEDIAELVGASHAAVRKRYSRALARLAEELRSIWNE